MSPLKVSVTAQTGRPFVPFLRKNLRRAYVTWHGLPAREKRSIAHGPAARATGLTLSLALVDDRNMSELHEEFMGIRGPTDVLTFPMDHDRRGGVVSGEVVVCVAEARRQARERGIPLRSELLLYAIHGMLHLLGYDDRTARGFRIMHRTEDELMNALGLGTVFARPAGGKSRGRPRK